MKCYFCLLTMLFLACKHEPAKTPVLQDSIKPSAKTNATEEPVIVSVWDFNGDGQPDDSITVHNETDDEAPDDDASGRWSIKFDNKTLPDLPLAGGMPTPVGEGDLNGDGAAELTIVQEPHHGCTYNITTWSFKEGTWKRVFGPDLVPTACDTIDYDALKTLIVKENGKVYFYKTDVDDEDFKKVKMEIKLRT